MLHPDSQKSQHAKAYGKLLMRSAELRNTERELQLFQVRIGIAGAIVEAAAA